MPIVIFYGIVMVLVAFILLTQVVWPAADRTIPYFPNFRPKAWRAAKLKMAHAAVKNCEATLRTAEDQLALAKGTGWHQEHAAQRDVTKAQYALRDAQLLVQEMEAQTKEEK